MFSLPKVFLHTHDMNAACLSRQCNCTRQSESTTQPTKMWGDLQRRISPGTRWSPSCLKHAWDTSVKQKKNNRSPNQRPLKSSPTTCLQNRRTPKHLSSFDSLWHYPCVCTLSSVQQTSCMTCMIHIVIPSHIESQDGDAHFWCMGSRASTKSNYPSSQATR